MDNPQPSDESIMEYSEIDYLLDNIHDPNMPGLMYKLTSPSGKSYIGQTVQTFTKRMCGHKNASKNPDKPGCRLLNAAIRAHGWDNFTKEVLVLCPAYQLDWYETTFISMYGTLAPDGYNLNTGGSLNKRHSEDTKAKMVESALARESASYRKSATTKDLPKHIVEIHERGMDGYIVQHPTLGKKKFMTSKLSMEEKLERATAYLNGLLSGDIVHVKRVKTTPKGIQKQPGGYRLVYTNKKGETITKSFSRSTISDEENLWEAIDALAWLKIEDENDLVIPEPENT